MVSAFSRWDVEFCTITEEDEADFIVIMNGRIGENRSNLARSKRKEATGRTYQQEREGKRRVGASGRRAASRSMGGKNAKRPTHRTRAQLTAARRNVRKAQAARRRAA